VCVCYIQEEDEDNHRSFLQKSPTASPEPLSEGDFPRSESGHLCLFPETSAAVDHYQYSHTSSGSEEEEKEELVGVAQEGNRSYPGPHESSVSPPEPELEQLDPYLNPQLDPYLNPRHSSSASSKTGSVSPGLREETTSASPHPQQVCDSVPVSYESHQLQASGPAGLEPEQSPSFKLDELQAGGSEVVQDVSPSQLDVPPVLPEPTVSVDTPTEGRADHMADYQDVEQVGGVSSSPVDSCLYAES